MGLDILWAGMGGMVLGGPRLLMYFYSLVLFLLGRVTVTDFGDSRWVVQQGMRVLL